MLDPCLTNRNQCVCVQLQEGASSVREMVMKLVGRKVAPLRMWLPLLFHTIAIMDSVHPPVFTHTDSQQLLSRVQVLALSATESAHTLCSLLQLSFGLSETMGSANVCLWPSCLHHMVLLGSLLIMLFMAFDTVMPRCDSTCRIDALLGGGGFFTCCLQVSPWCNCDVVLCCI